MGFSEVGGFTETDARRPGCVTRAAPSTVRPPSLGHLQRHRGDDDAVVIGVNVLARAEGNATEGHRHVTVTDAALFGLHRVAGQSLNTQSSLDQNIYITHTAVDDDAFPAILAAFSASMSPSRARRMEPPPSTTMTLPVPSSSTSSLTTELSSKHLTVTISPPKESWPPKLLNIGSTTATSG